MQAQQSVAFAWNRKQIGKTIDVILDQRVPAQPGAWVGRSWADAPDVDGLVFVTQADHKLHAGQIVPCQIVTHKDYDLVGVAAGKPR
jgi:ribosomal protein S12 methylthiotransferase